MIIHVVDGKGHKDRWDLPLEPNPPRTCVFTRRWLKPRDYLFPSRKHRHHEQPIGDKTVWLACTEAAKKAGIRKKSFTPHPRSTTDRHAPARSRYRPAYHSASARS